MKVLTKVLAAVAMLVSASATMGCVVIIADEPKALKSMMD